MKSLRPLDRPRTYVVGMLLIVGATLFAINPSLTDFDSNQFSTTSPSFIHFKSGGSVTNLFVATGITGIGASAGSWTLNAGTGTGGFTNNAGPVYGTNANGTYYLNGDTNSFSGKVGIGSDPSDHVLTVTSTNNNSLAINSTGTDSASMGHLQNVGVQGPFFDWHSAGGHWAVGNSQAGDYSLRYSAGSDAVNGTVWLNVLPSGEFIFLGPTNHGVGDLGIDGILTAGTFRPTNITGQVFSAVPGPMITTNGSGNFGFSYDLGSDTNLPGSSVNIVWGSGTTASTNGAQVTVVASGSIPAAPNPFSIYGSTNLNVTGWIDPRNYAYAITELFAGGGNGALGPAGETVSQSGTGAAADYGTVAPSGMQATDFGRLSISNTTGSESFFAWRDANSSVNSHPWQGPLFFETKAICDTITVGTTTTNHAGFYGIWDRYNAIPHAGVGWINQDAWSANWIAGCGVANTFTYYTSSIPITTFTQLAVTGTTNSVTFYTNGVAMWTNTANLCGGTGIAPLCTLVHVTASSMAGTAIYHTWIDYLIYYLK